MTNRLSDRFQRLLRQGGYVANEQIALMAGLAVEMGRPLLLEGPAGSGKTALAEALAAALKRPLVRLSCYEGLTADEALYDWNYHQQWVALQQGSATDPFSRRFLLARPLLKAVETPETVLLIDEVDRADEAFEALLLEYLSEFQISIPELGTIKAAASPLTILTSNRQRPLSDALRRRCLYLYVDWPEREREIAIVETALPSLDRGILDRLVNAVRCLRQWDLVKPPGLAETLDWARAWTIMRPGEWDRVWIQNTLGLVIKDAWDLETVNGRIDDLVDADPT